MNRLHDNPKASELPFPAEAKWISGGSLKPEGSVREAEENLAAPVLERRFTLGAVPHSAVLSLAVAGWHEVWVNGVRAGDEVLHPATCQPNVRLPSVTREIAPLLRRGDNTLAVLLGNGWFNPITREGSFFATAPWVDTPMVRGALVADGATLFVTDGDWLAYDSPIVFNAFRNGEWHDARKEGARENERAAKVVKYTPCAEISPDDAPPCRAFDPVAPVREIPVPGGVVYDFGTNRSGWCEIAVEGERGAKVSVDYEETLKADGTFLGHATAFVRRWGDPRPAQHDEYTLAGREGGERWHPRFAYHGFRYALVKTEGVASLKTICGVFVHSDLPSAGSVVISDRTFAKLQDAARRSYLSNFVGIPTDCPHREKNGWTGDAQLAMETGLWNFDARDGYVHYLRMILDAQRPNGQVPCILPCNGTTHYRWGTGPAWDAALFEIPWQLFRFYGDDGPAREAYGAMKRYLSFIRSKARPDGLVEYGLGDWAAPEGMGTVPVLLTDSAYVWQFHGRLAFWADHFGEQDVAEECLAGADAIRAAFSRAFYRGGGLYAGGQPTALAAPLFFKGLCADGAEDDVASELARRMRGNGHRACFGILGSKWIPRALSDHGFIDDAWRIFTQPEAPGLAAWTREYDTLWEILDTDREYPYSKNHIMFGDFSAWAYEYLAGIKIVEPGFAKVDVKPHLPEGVESFDIRHQSPRGEIRVVMKRGASPRWSVALPPGLEPVMKEELP